HPPVRQTPDDVVPATPAVEMGRTRGSATFDLNCSTSDRRLDRFPGLFGGFWLRTPRALPCPTHRLTVAAPRNEGAKCRALKHVAKIESRKAREPRNTRNTGSVPFSAYSVYSAV